MDKIQLSASQELTQVSLTSSGAAMSAKTCVTQHYNLARTVNEIRPAYGFDASCQGTVPEALVALFDTTSYEDTVRNAVSLGGDSDTPACIAGGVPEAHYSPLPPSIGSRVRSCLTEGLCQITEQFCRRYGIESE